MDWLRRSAPPQLAEGAAPPDARPGAAETAAPGVAALLQGVGEDRRHAVLDLGTATNPNLRAYTQFALRIRFADVLGETVTRLFDGPTPGQLRTDLPADRLYDLVFAWDILDRLVPEERPRLLQWLADITLPTARLHFIVRAEHALDVPLRFTLVEVNRFRFEPTQSAHPIGRRLLPAEVTKMLPPFRIAKSFTLRSGFREYVVVPPPPAEPELLNANFKL